MKNKNFKTEFTNPAAYFQADEMKGLVLSGGVSTRTGRDKGDLIYHTQP